MLQAEATAVIQVHPGESTEKTAIPQMSNDFPTKRPMIPTTDLWNHSGRSLLLMRSEKHDTVAGSVRRQPARFCLEAPVMSKAIRFGRIAVLIRDAWVFSKDRLSGHPSRLTE